MSTAQATSWQRGRFDAHRGPSKVLFGRMYEDPQIELAAFRPGGRVLCIASAGCTAMALAPHHEVVAVDINPSQLAYARRRLAGASPVRGSAERIMSLGRAFGPLVGWSHAAVHAFLELASPPAQLAFWHDHLDTRRFRAAVDGLLSIPTLRMAYASPLLDVLPPRLGAVMRARMARCFARHANRGNPYACALLLGELADTPPPAAASAIQLVQADAAELLERTPAGTFVGFTLSNILDGASDAYRQRLFAAVKRAAAPDAVVVLRSFREPSPAVVDNRAADDRSMIWGVVEVRAVAQLA